MTRQPNVCPSIVLGNGESALGVIRSLHRAGIPVIYSSDKSEIAAWSRVHEPFDNWPNGTLNPSALEQWLESTNLKCAILMPCSDPWVQSVSRLSEETCQRFRRWTPSAEAVDTMVDKDRFRSVLELLGLPHPRSYHLERDIGAWQIPENVFESAFLKPHDSPTFLAAFGVKGFSVESPDQAFDQCQVIWEENIDVMLQEYVLGPPTNHYFVDGYRPKDGSAIQFLARQRLEMFPPDFGNSTDMVTVPLSSVEPALKTLVRLFEHTQFHGIFSAEFKQDERDGLFKILEVNCRPWWFIDYADRCGLQVSKAAYLDALDLEIPDQKPYRLGKRGTYPTQDLEAFLNKERRDAASFFAMVFNWLRSYQPIFSWSDPMPAVVKFFRMARGAIKRRMVRTSAEPTG